MVNQILRIFPDARVASGYVRVRCPYHKGGNEKRPSMSILLERRGEMLAGTCHCFACGKVVQIEELLDYIGVNQDITIDKSRQTLSTRINLLTTHTMYKPQLPFRFSPYLHSRGISEEVQMRFKVYEKDKRVYMPVFNRGGKYLFVVSRGTEGKYYNVEEGAVKTLYGIEEISLSKPIVVTEGQIDTMSFWQLGIQAVATLGADNIGALEEIKSSTSLIILAFDNDPAGLRARDRAAEMLGRFRCKYIQFPEGVDINELLTTMESEKLLKYISENTFRLRT